VVKEFALLLRTN